MRHMLRLPPLLLLLMFATAHAQETEDWLNQAQQINRDLVHKEDPDARMLLRIQSNLANHQDNPHHIALQANKHYTFFGDCDRNCHHLGLTLIHNGQVLRRSDTAHPFPILTWQATASGRYILRVQMQNCRHTDCLYNISIFESKRSVF